MKAIISDGPCPVKGGEVDKILKMGIYWTCLYSPLTREDDRYDA